LADLDAPTHVAPAPKDVRRDSSGLRAGLTSFTRSVLVEKDNDEDEEEDLEATKAMMEKLRREMRGEPALKPARVVPQGINTHLTGPGPRLSASTVFSSAPEDSVGFGR
jgi:hypothetical protein